MSRSSSTSPLISVFLPLFYEKVILMTMRMGLTRTVRVTLTIILGILIEVEGYRPQEIILFSGSNYTGQKKSFFASHPELRSDSIGKIAKSHCVVRGLWRINGTFKSKSGVQFIENIYGDEKSGKICGSWDNASSSSSNKDALEYRGIMLLGSPDLDTSAINFNIKPRFYGNEQLYFDGRVLRLPKPLNFSSFAFTGRHNWTVFKSTDLTGASDCLVANIDHFGGSGVTFNFNRSVTMGSIWRGCGSLNLKRGGDDETDTRSDKNKDTDKKNGAYRNMGSGFEYIVAVLMILSPYNNDKIKLF